MSLNDAQRKELDFAIDNTIKYVTEMKFLFKQEKVKSDLGYDHGVDFLLGYFWRWLFLRLWPISNLSSKKVIRDSNRDTIPIVVDRMNEVRDKIFRTGG